MASSTSRQPAWVTTLFEKVNKPIRAKLQALISHGLAAADGDLVFDGYLAELAKGVREAVRIFIHLFFRHQLQFTGFS